MSQNNVNYADNPTGPQLMDNYLAKSQENNLTTNSGLQRPTYAKAGTFWINSSANPWVLYFYNGSKDVAIGTIGTGSSGTFSVEGVDLSDVVDRSTNQTIGGTKTFTNNLKSKATYFLVSQLDINRTDTPSSKIDRYIEMVDKNGVGAGNSYGRIKFSVDTNKTTSCELYAYKAQENNLSDSVYIGVYYPASGSAYTYAPTPATSDNSTKIATTAYVKAQGYASDSDVVKTTGDQNIGGTKTFTSNINQSNTNPSFRQNNTNITKGTAPSSNFTGYPVVYRDTNGANLSWLTYAVSTGNLSATRFHTAKAKAGSSSEAYLEVRYSAADGQYGLYFGASNPESGDTNTSLTKSTTSTADTTVPTMGWVNSKLVSIGVNTVDFFERINLTSSISLNTSYTFANSGLFVININVASQPDATVTLHVSNGSSASASNHDIAVFKHQGGSAENNTIPFSIPMTKGQSIYLAKTGGGSGSIVSAYLLPWVS